MGNIFGRWQGSDASAGAVLTGSHCDAIPLAGLYDGTLGVLGGIAALKALKDAVRHRRRRRRTCLPMPAHASLNPPEAQHWHGPAAGGSATHWTAPVPV